VPRARCGEPTAKPIYAVTQPPSEVSPLLVAHCDAQAQARATHVKLRSTAIHPRDVYLAVACVHLDADGVLVAEHGVAWVP
jgi:hypothetical protein